jgi:hypothetical protein
MFKMTRPDLVFLGISILTILLLAGLTWGNYQFAVENPGGNDFVPRYIGTRLFLLDGFSPYSDEATLKIQEMIYGRAAEDGEDQQLFVYPLYSVLFFFPFSLIENYPLARAAWMAFLEIGLLVIAFASLVAMRWRPGRLVLAFFLLFSLIWYHAFRSVINGNPAILVTIFISLMFLFVVNQNYWAAGVMLAFATIKPHMVILLIPFVLWWACTRREMGLITSFFVTMVFLVGIMIFRQPDWMIANLRQVLLYPEYTQPGTPGGIFAEWWPRFGTILGWGLTSFLSVVLLREWFAASKKDVRWFLWAAGLTLAITNLIGIRTATANYIALFPVLVFVFTVWQEHWRKASDGLAFVTMLVLLVGLWWLFVSTLIQTDQSWQHPIMFFPMPVFLICALYWVRNWALGPRRMQIEEFGE